MKTSTFTLLLLLIFVPSTHASGDEPTTPDPHIAKVEALRQALQEEDFARAATFLSDDPRVWYDERQGDGIPWQLRAGRWKAWDTHFNGVSELQGTLQSAGDRVWADYFESNDYFRLLERGGGYFRKTWFFTDDGKIEGYMISAVPGAPEAPPGRADEFLAWARENAPEELDYLRPGGRLDPTGDRAPRTRALLERWRQAIGEPMVEDDGS